MDRCYLTSILAGKMVLRVIELGWDIINSSSRDSSVVVVDGSTLLLTPLGFATVPPPMSKYQVSAPAAVRSASFWHRPASVTALAINGAWGLAALTEGNLLRLWFAKNTGEPGRCFLST